MSLYDTVWEYETRTLQEGSDTSPSSAAERIAKAVWSYSPRTLNETAVYGIIDFPNIVLIDGLEE